MSTVSLSSPQMIISTVALCFPLLAFSWQTFSQLRNHFLSKIEPRSHSCAAPNQVLGLGLRSSWAVGYIGSSWQPRAPFSGLQGSLLTLNEIFHCHLNTQFKARAARTKPQGPGQGEAKSHHSISMSSSTRACQRPNHQTCKCCKGWVTSAYAVSHHCCSPSLVRHYRKETIIVSLRL